MELIFRLCSWPWTRNLPVMWGGDRCRCWSQKSQAGSQSRHMCWGSRNPRLSANTTRPNSTSERWQFDVRLTQQEPPFLAITSRLNRKTKLTAISSAVQYVQLFRFSRQRSGRWLSFEWQTLFHVMLIWAHCWTNIELRDCSPVDDRLGAGMTSMTW